MTGLLFQTTELHSEHRSLPFAETVVRPVNEMAVEPFSRHASAVMNGARLTLEGIVIRNDDSALARGHKFARLKAERCGGPESADLATVPLAAMGVRRVFDEMNLVTLGNVLQSI